MQCPICVLSPDSCPHQRTEPGSGGSHVSVCTKLHPNCEYAATAFLPSKGDDMDNCVYIVERQLGTLVWRNEGVFNSRRAAIEAARRLADKYVNRTIVRNYRLNTIRDDEASIVVFDSVDMLYAEIGGEG